MIDFIKNGFQLGEFVAGIVILGTWFTTMGFLLAVLGA